MNVVEIGSNNYGERRYSVFVGTGVMWSKEFKVYAYNETEAVDLVADYCEEHLLGLCADHYELADLCNAGQTVDEYAYANNLTCCGNHGVYMDIVGVEEIQ